MWCAALLGYTFGFLMAHLESLVVLDPQPKSREALVFGFARAGYSVYATGEARDAFEAAARVEGERAPQLVVTSTSLAGDWGEAMDLVGKLREVSETRALPMACPLSPHTSINRAA